MSMTTIALWSVIKSLAGLWLPGSWEVTPKSLEFPKWWKCLCYLWWAPRTISELCREGEGAGHARKTQYVYTMKPQWKFWTQEAQVSFLFVDTYWCTRTNHNYHTFLNSRSPSSKLSNLRWVVGTPIFVVSRLEVEVMWRSPHLWLVSKVTAILQENVLNLWSLS